MRGAAPWRIALTGIDGAGKDTALMRTLRELDGRYSVAKCTRPAFTLVGGELTPVFGRTHEIIDGMHALADETRSRRLVLVANAINVVVQTRWIEPELTRRVQPELLLGVRDFLVDPAVYSTFYARSSLGRLEPAARLSVLRRLTRAPLRDLVVLLTVEPGEAVRRIGRRLEEDRTEGAPSRRKWRHLHEDVENLQRLQEEYYRVLERVQGAEGVPVVEIDTTGRTPAEVASLVVGSILECTGRGLERGSWARS